MRTAAVYFIITTPAFAFGLTDADYAYLAGQHVSKDSAVIGGLSPKEQARLHAIIIDDRTANDPAAQARNVADAVELFQSHHDWEQTHPGELWDSPKRRAVEH